MDKYPNFKTLAAGETQGADFRIRVQDRGSNISIIAPHGGLIESRTSWIAESIAGDTYNYYCFEGIKDKNNRDLHITSHQFDEPGALNLISASDIVITIHACKAREAVVYIGGRSEALGYTIRNALEKSNLKTSQKQEFAGRHPDNICNRGRTGKGVQLEISRGLRDDPRKLHLLSKAVRNVLKCC